MTVADRIAEFVAERVQDVFLLSGGGMMYLLDSLGKRDDITIHCHNHEQDAGIAAEAYARISESPSFCFATSGPGGLNCVEVISECWLDSVPVIFIIGQNSRKQTTRLSGITGLRGNGPSEIDIIPIVSSITKKSYFVDSPSMIDTILYEAYYTANEGRPGPVVISVPLDVQNSEYTPLPSGHDIAEFLNKSSKPLILLGKGFPRKEMDSLISFCRTNYIPIVTTQAAKDLIQHAESSFMGHIGIKGNRNANKIVMESNFIISLGASLHTFTTGYNKKMFAPNAKIIYVDIDATQLARCDLPNVIKVISESSLFFLRDVVSTSLISRDDYWCKKENKDENYINEENRLNIYNAIRIVNRFSASFEIIVSDAGSSFYAVGQEWKLKYGQRFISSNALGTMGWALPAAYGASSYSEKKVWCFTGDGSFITGLNEIYHIQGERRNIAIIVFNNDGYLSIRNTQDSFFGSHYVGTDKNNGVHLPSIANILNGIRHYVITNGEELKTALSKEIEENTPCVIEIMTNHMQRMEPTVGNIANPDGTISSGTLDNMEPSL